MTNAQLIECLYVVIVVYWAYIVQQNLIYRIQTLRTAFFYVFIILIIVKSMMIEVIY